MKKLSFGTILLCCNILLVIGLICFCVYRVNNGGFYKETLKESLAADTIVENSNSPVLLTPYVEGEDFSQYQYSIAPADPSCMKNLRQYNIPDGTTIYMVDAVIDGVLINIQVINEETFWTLDEAMQSGTYSIEFVIVYATGNKLPILLMVDKD